ncbi:MAG: 30S ribosomal protein S8 [Clostridia bacterium]
MSMTDPIADMLTRVRNASAARHERVDIPGSKVKWAIAEILKREGYVKDVSWIDDDKQGVVRVYLKYGPDKQQIISGMKRISKPGLRIYVGKDDVPRVLGGLGIAIMSTSRGIMTDKDARSQVIGGEVMAYVW